MKKYNLISIIGPTASGKTEIATKLAFKINGEILSADSRQVYIGMNLGTGKDYEDYIIENQKIKYHLIDIKQPGYKYNVFEYQKDFFIKYQEVTNDKKIPILCGGSGMYIEAILNNYNLKEVPPNFELRNKLETKSLDELKIILKKYKNIENKSDFDSKKRAIRAIEIEEYQYNNKDYQKFPHINSLVVGIKYPREIEKERITKRLYQRVEMGMIEEVEDLLNIGITPEDLIYYGLEYKFITKYIIGEYKKDEMIKLLNFAIHQFAKRQMTWFRRMEKNGTNIIWLNHEISTDKKINQIITLID